MSVTGFLEQIPVIGWIMEGSWGTQGIRASIAGAAAAAIFSAGGYAWSWVDQVNETVSKVETIEERVDRWRKYQREAQSVRQQLKENQQSILDHLRGRFESSSDLEKPASTYPGAESAPADN